MNDFELTRLAFKAAFSGADLTEDKDMMRNWSPLTDDGDALRLAVAMRMGINHSQPSGSARHWVSVSISGLFGVEEFHYEDQRIEATRRAIVRAAAEIGRIKHDTQ